MTLAIQIAAAFYLDRNASNLKFSFAGCMDHLASAGLILIPGRREHITDVLKSFWRSLIGGWGHLLTAAEYWQTRWSRSAMAVIELKAKVADPAALRRAVDELPENFFYYFRSDHRAKAYKTMKRHVMWSIGTSDTHTCPHHPGSVYRGQAQAQHVFAAVDLVDITRPGAAILEAPAALFVADNAKLFQQFTAKVGAINYVMHIITMEASKYGSLQARPRLYPVLIRREIHGSRRPFYGPSPHLRRCSRRAPCVILFCTKITLISQLFGLHNIGCAFATAQTIYPHIHEGPRCEWPTEGEGTACNGYSLDGSAPTQTGSDTHVFDDRLGYMRRLHEQERLNIILDSLAFSFRLTSRVTSAVTSSVMRWVLSAWRPLAGL
jgi:hypothetical protein